MLPIVNYARNLWHFNGRRASCVFCDLAGGCERKMSVGVCRSDTLESFKTKPSPDWFMERVFAYQLC